MALPTELDFVRNPEASPGRMNAAMEYLISRLRALEALTPEFESSINLLRQIGLERLAEVLVPIFEDANTTAALIEALRVEYETDTFKAALQALITDDVVGEFADYRQRWLGAKSSAPTVDDTGAAVQLGAMYFDTSLDKVRVLSATGWKDAGSTVSGTMESFALTATAAQTTFTIPGGYDVGNIVVFINGLALKAADFTATNGTTVVVSARTAGDSVSGVKFGAISIATVYSKTEANALFRTIADSYTKAQVDSALTAKAATGAAYTKAEADGRYFKIASDLSESGNSGALRTALGLGTLAVLNSVGDSTFTGLLSVAKGGTGVSSLAALLANLAAYVGDSGSGGTKGLVPAPAAGDAAAKKVLCADGTWTSGVNRIWGKANGSGSNGSTYFVGNGIADVVRVSSGTYYVSFTTARAGAYAILITAGQQNVTSTYSSEDANGFYISMQNGNGTVGSSPQNPVSFSFEIVG